MSVPTAASTIRQKFLEFFQKSGHTIVRSSPLVPDDPSLLFTNAGMVQFKDVFTGKTSLDFTRAASAQKCVRAGGKHNDLENVGRTARHHTFFEMMGNFSFGGYFKEEAILLAWEFISQELNLSSENLYFTVFAGEDGIPEDKEARLWWQKITGVSKDHILGLGKKDNFWMMGDVGPQGPCSEIHYYQGSEIPCIAEQQGGACLGPACECDRFLEIWNLVFMQFERREKDGPLLSLPKPSIDTGAGLERLCAVVQGKLSNYDTDLFTPLLDYIQDQAQLKYTHNDSETDVSMRVMADHCRATAFLIADGVLPSNLGRGYVLRSIMRRAIRHAVKLNLSEGVFAELCMQVLQPNCMGNSYPELLQAQSLIKKSVNSEDVSFRATIHRGLKLIADTKQWIVQGESKVLPGEIAFQLHDTYGFPLDLTQTIGREKGFLVDEAGFVAEMKKQKERSKFAGSGDQNTGEIYYQVRSLTGGSKFLGYTLPNENHVTAQVKAILWQGEQVSQVQAPAEIEVIVDQTPFYGRSGGQMGDTGVITALGVKIEVLDTWKPLPDFIVHRCRLVQGNLRTEQQVTLDIDVERRGSIAKNHSATHLLHHALRQILGEHVTQKGSSVGPEKLTFDFSHFEPLPTEICHQIEQHVNFAIQKNSARNVTETTVEQARTLGALSLFGEKYGDVVRVMELGDSRELCGGTHVDRTGDIGLFKILSETGIAKGIRRIEAITGMVAVKWGQQLESEMGQIADSLKATPKEVINKIQALQATAKNQERELVTLKQKFLRIGSEGQKQQKSIAGFTVVVQQIPDADPKVLKQLAETLINNADIVAVGGGSEGKAALVVAVSAKAALYPHLQAKEFIEKLAPVIGGKGGGKAQIAQAGGSQPEQLPAVLQMVFAMVANTAELPT